LRRIAFDTNILAYASGLRRSADDDEKIIAAEQLIDRAYASEIVVLSIQACLELHHLLVRKGGTSQQYAQSVVEKYAGRIATVDSDASLMRSAFALAEAHRFQTYDAIILAAAASADCEILYSEDMQHGFIWGGVMVANPFA